ncbi:amino acid/amide ABC transporter substrate-binding protein, HAAT family [Loktanella atrilutea]|uniref:Amino acid/amide ABC transporter substrate-binding protein, HAAT family n=1 Tax=Loktanella atrilutea TaxID=366533 RepID=A0A1M5C7P9_LOKAT|nr:ABC transporter substrate-binding protein [Loktanella atrilutea]SHF50778.1 amino acid/amide ABC transporter substrate-binding protein, HAAT family [Loktanella atrilutea]
MTPFIRTLALAGLAAIANQAHAESGIAPDKVSFAQVAALDGPAAALGTGMREGIRAAFEEANRAGGVHGRMVNLDSFDDGYEPDRSVALVRKVIADDSHLGFIGAVGTPTAQAAQPIATEAGLPFIAPFTGAGFLRDPALKNVVNVRASFGAETEAWISYLVDGLGLSSIAILYQDDGFGRVGLDGVTQALDRRGMTLAAQGTYTRNTVAVKSALLDIRKAAPEAVVMVGAYKPIAEFIRLSKSLNFDPTFVNISFVGSDALAAELGPDGAGVIISQVVPFPWDASLKVVADYHAAIAAVDPAAQPSFVTLEGYLAGRVALRALDAAGPDLTREGFLAAMNGLGSFSLDGLDFAYGPSDNQGMDSVFLTRITDDGNFETVAVPEKQASN